jgi:hypothetical protein
VYAVSQIVFNVEHNLKTGSSKDCMNALTEKFKNKMVTN